MRLKRLAASPVYYLIALSSYPYFCNAQSAQFEGLSVQAATGLQQQTVKVEGLSICNSPFKFANLNFDSWYSGLPIGGYVRTDAFNIMAGLGYRF